MKHVISLVLALLMIATMFVFASCGKDNPSETSSDMSSEQPKELTKTEAFDLAIQNLTEAFTANAFSGISNPLENSTQGTVSTELKLDSITGDEDNFIVSMLNSAAPQLGVNVSFADGKADGSVLLSLFKEVIDIAFTQIPEQGIFLQLKGIMEKPILVTPSSESTDEISGEDSDKNIDFEGFMNELMKLSSEIFDPEKKLTMEKGENNKKTFTFKLDTDDLVKLNSGIEDLAKKYLNGITFDSDIDATDKPAMVFTMETVEDFPVSIVLESSEKEKTVAKVSINTEKKDGSFIISGNALAAEEENAELSEAFRFNIQQTISGDKMTVAIECTSGKNVLKGDYSATKKDGTITYEMTIDATIEAGQSVSVNLDDVVTLKGTMNVSDNKFSEECKLTVNVNGTVAVLSLKTSIENTPADIKAPADYDTPDTLDPDALLGKIREKLPSISSLIEMLIGGDEPDGEGYLYVNEDGSVYLNVSKDFSSVYALSIGAFYDDNGSEFTLFDDNGNGFFVLPYEFSGDTATVFGTVMIVDRSYEDMICWLSDDMEFDYVTAVSEKMANLTIWDLDIDGDAIVKTFADGHTETFDFSVSEDGSTVTVGGATLNYFEVPSDWDEDVI